MEYMNAKMIKIAGEIDRKFKRYIKEFEKVNGDCCGMVFITKNNTKEIICYAENFKKLKEVVLLIPGDPT